MKLMPLLSHAGTAVAGAVALFTYLEWSEGQYNWAGLDLVAEINAKAQPRLMIPTAYEHQPSEVYAIGSIASSENISAIPTPFKVRLTQVNDASNDDYRIIVLQDIRPLVCNALDRKNCEKYKIVSLALEATFPRGNKPATVEPLLPISLL